MGLVAPTDQLQHFIIFHLTVLCVHLGVHGEMNATILLVRKVRKHNGMVFLCWITLWARHKLFQELPCCDSVFTPEESTAAIVLIRFIIQTTLP